MQNAGRTGRVLAIAAAALATAMSSPWAQPPVPASVLRAGALEFTAHSTVGEFVGTTASVAGAAGGTSLAVAQAWVEAPVASLAIGNGRRDRDMRAALESDRYPTLRFDVKGVRADAGALTDSTRATVRGALAIHGVTRDLGVPVTLVRRGDTVHVTSAFSLRLSDYHVDGLRKAFGLLRVRDDVQVRADLRYVVGVRGAQAVSSGIRPRARAARPRHGTRARGTPRSAVRVQCPRMLAAVRSAAVLGIDAFDVTVEVDATNGLPLWSLVGLPASAVRESRERVSAALAHAGMPLPPRRVTVNLAPGDVRKEGTAFDLPIAVAALVATGQLAPRAIQGLALAGELALDGTLRPLRGAIPIARWAAAQGVRLVLPPANVGEASRVPGARLAAPITLRELVDGLRRGRLAPAAAPPTVASAAHAARPWDDFAEVVGQAAAKRALEVAAAGGHNVLLVGPPGAGKTMLARRLPSILPELSDAESLEVLAVQSVAGLLGDALPPSPLRPFRAPHHTISTAGLVGGGSAPRPGEVSLAHLGVLFLDELLEFPRHVLDALRQPMEDGRVLIARAATAVAYPARFTLVAATNPCPCGRAGDPKADCMCTPRDVARYQARLSGPLGDRIDMHVRVGAVPAQALGGAAPAEASADIRARVERARARQRRRYAAMAHVACNAQAGGRWLDAHTPVAAEARALLVQATERLGLSARGYHRVLKVARTIADLAEEDAVAPAHVAEALRFRTTVGGAAGARAGA